jgi:hypothetical protein
MLPNWRSVRAAWRVACARFFGILVAIVCVVLFLIAWLLLEYALKLTRQISDARLRLAELRAKGVKLRNCALGTVTDGVSFDRWRRQVERWRKQVERELEKISKSDAVWFSVLDIVPPPRIAPVMLPPVQRDADAFLKLFREHDLRLRRLGKMIRDLWGRK